MYRKMQASQLTEFILSHAPQLTGSNPVSLFTLLLAFPQLLSSHHGGWQHLQDDSLGSLVVSQGKNLLGAQLLGGFLLCGSPRFILVFPVPGLTCDNSSQQDSQKRKLKTVWGSHSKAQEMCLLSQRAVLSSSDQHHPSFCLPF